MIPIKRGTRLNPDQIALERLFSVKRVLASRGFIVQKDGKGSDTLIDKEIWESIEADTVFKIFHNARHRKELLDYILGTRSTPSPAITPITTHKNFIGERGRFSATFEWYLGHLLETKFQSFSSSFGVVVNDVCRNSDNGDAGDFDVLSILGDMSLLYIECKSGATTPGEILKAIERSYSLHCVATVIIVEKLPEGALIEMLKTMKYPNERSVSECLKLSIKKRKDSEIFKWYNCYFVRSSENIEAQLQIVLRLKELSRISIALHSEPDDGDYSSTGYELEKINLITCGAGSRTTKAEG